VPVQRFGKGKEIFHKQKNTLAKCLSIQIGAEFDSLYTDLSVNNTLCLFIYLLSTILGYMFRSHGPSSGLQHYHNTDPNYSIVTIEISTSLHGKLCFSVKTQTKSQGDRRILV
jgi:hypothetical protein